MTATVRPTHKTSAETLGAPCSAYLRSLIDALNATEAPYCHWKSNYSLPEAFAGDEDLDLLVERGSLSAVLGLLAELGFKQARVRRGENPAGVSHYYGHDPETGRLVHVHLFSRVLTGESFVKAHLLPFDRMLLDEPADFEGLKTASPQAELVLFLVRNFIKYGSLFDFPYLIRGQEKTDAEFAWLRAQCDLDQTLDAAVHFCPALPRSLWLRCLEAFEQGWPPQRRVVLAWKVRRKLRVYCVRSRYDRWRAYAGLLATKLRRTLFRLGKNKQFAEGGAVIAFVGPEATGKSTLVEQCRCWLGEAVAVRSIHAGKPPSAWLSLPINVLLPRLRRLLPHLRSSRVEGHVAAKPAVEESNGPPRGRSGGFLYAVRSVSLAWDRRRLLLRARRAAAAGEIVVCDRYPAEATGAMDSPRISRREGGNRWSRAAYNQLVAWEQWLYRQIPPPDVVLKLSVSLETAKERNRTRVKAGKESDAYVESRHRIAAAWQRAGTKHIVDISTEGSLDETIERMKQTVWSLI